MNKEELWQAVLAKMELTLSKPSFLTWFQETGILNLNNGNVTIHVPNNFVKEWLQNKYHKTILHTLRELTSGVKEVKYVIIKPKIVPARRTYSKKQTTKKDALAPFINEQFSIKELSVDPETNLNPRYSFDNFVVGSFNELAHAAAQAIIKNPGTSYNPLFIYGGVGLGKTHLIQAIGNEMLKKYPGIKVRYAPSEKYMSEVVDALKSQTMNQLKAKYKEVDLLIIDDIQFIARTEKMQEEFFHMFNTLYQKNKQIVVSSDRPPHAIATLEERLRSRFEGGMIADIGVPDFETRLVILKTKIEDKGVIIPEEVLRFIAENIKTNIRELEGALNRVIINAKVSNSPITKEIARKSIKSHLSAPKKFISAKKIIKTVAEFYDISEKDLTTRSRRKEIVRPRQIGMYLMREELKYSYPSIGEYFGGRDHTTAMHSCEKIAEELKTNPELEEEIKMICQKMYSD